MRSVPCILMRGGSSKGPFFRTSDLPSLASERDEILIGLMGSGHELEIDGVGGGNPLSSKVTMVDHSLSEGVDVDYLFAQVDVLDRKVDVGPNCGNMLVAVGPFAIETGLVSGTHPETRVRIRNVNTGALIEAIVQTPSGSVTYDGTTSIDAVPGSAAPVRLTFSNTIGSKTGKLFPTGQRKEIILDTEVTLIDMSVPVLMMAAESLGKTGYEMPAELDADRDFYARIEAIRVEAGLRMGLGQVSGSVLPKIIILSAPRRQGTINARYFMPRSCHKSFAVTGGICLATACITAETVARPFANWASNDTVRVCRIEHPAGEMEVEVELDDQGSVKRASIIRTARKLFSGQVYAP